MLSDLRACTAAVMCQRGLEAFPTWRTVPPGAQLNQSQLLSSASVVSGGIVQHMGKTSIVFPDNGQKAVLSSIQRAGHVRVPTEVVVRLLIPASVSRPCRPCRPCRLHDVSTMFPVCL
ncbi:hypothetical protein CLAFUW4_05578 [Fulvia fulva]|uniref:Uncharacterized protein n=1 Tax=Passalora fulva TaxID=5499 RepID=A0A9Q8LH15_PASFU|nr:uncharacterized protein CLAFUR5_05720 [Fulvia fulva]KAK4623654.1 hypothetical protein CLAFUR4_05572 [Fulvia fulva]KAK4625177.1 hypothetical protein CLAFUR0_05581 [Fulvia fulva]UJO17317.1 hypothetical protein CLAFUR5_05720 [Fulvia fulva]WPV15514.1 hypothetical protein CLAFUW4_05578 [Fulvia fulva]WPV30497.1 hypothetical protein CLAFUW7_05576 [Fulvia fulva]